MPSGQARTSRTAITVEPATVLPKGEYWVLVLSRAGGERVPKFHRVAWGERSRQVEPWGWASVCGQEWRTSGVYAPEYGLMRRLHAQMFAEPCRHCWETEE